MILSKDCNKDWMWNGSDPEDEMICAAKRTRDFLNKFDTLKLDKDFSKNEYPDSDIYVTKKLLPEIEKLFSEHAAMWSGGVFIISYEPGYDEKDRRVKTPYIQTMYLLLKKRFSEYNPNIMMTELDYVNRWFKIKIKK